MERINLSKNTFAEIPDSFVPTEKINIIFQYRWLSSAKPENSGINAIYVYADSAGLNSGQADELGDPEYVNRTVEKLLGKYNAELDKLVFCAYSGGGLAFWKLFQKKDKIKYKIDLIIMSDANYGGKVTAPVWAELSKEAMHGFITFVMLHTRSLEKQFNSTTKTAVETIKLIEQSYAAPSDNLSGFTPIQTVEIGGLNIIDLDVSHQEAGKLVPALLKKYF